ncbi:MAG: PAS domain S-box protein [Candidatus Sumerlaeota bacterium]|nr:PAS domain S-box protein [Candidatus Sumerlaeota bacterium]
MTSDSEKSKEQLLQALRDSEAQYRRIVETALEGIWTVDKDFRITFVNQRMAQLLGYGTEEIVGQPVASFMAPEEIPDHEKRIRMRMDGVSEQYERRFLRKDGRIVTLLVSASVLSNEQGRFNGAFGMFTDITARKQAEEALRRCIAFQELVTRISTRFSLYSSAEIDKGIEKALEEIANFIRIERAFVTLAAPDHKKWSMTHEWHQPEIAGVMQRYQDFSGATFAWSAQKIRNGQPIVIHTLSDYPEDAAPERETSIQQGVKSMLCLPLHGQGGFLTGCLGFDAFSREHHWEDDDVQLLQMVSDLFANALDRKRIAGERRNLERQVQQAQKLESLGVLAGGIAHDFNNLLMTILGNADLALSELPAESPARDGLREIEAASRRAAELCKQMLAYSGKGNFQIEPVHLSRLVEEMGHMLEVSISKKAVLRYRFADNLPTVEADATQIRQIIMNLIINASEAIGDKSGIISVSTGAMECDSAYLGSAYLHDQLPGGLYVYLEVSDTGCGMNDETKAKLFDPFFTTKFSGRGLGLAAVLGIVRGHQGAIKVYSELGRGTTFKILFPASQISAIAIQEDKKAAPWKGSGTILIVDDEDSVRTLAKRMVERCGFKVLTAAHGQEALHLYRQHAPDIICVLMDLTMPHMDGEEAFREMRRVRPDVRVVLSSGYNEQEITQRFAGKGLAGFIQKPYQMAALSEILRKALTKQ